MTHIIYIGQEKVKIPQDLSHLKIMSMEEVETIGAEPDNSKAHVKTLTLGGGGIRER